VSPSRCIAFDLDDTLFLERDYVRSGFRAVGTWAERELGIQGVGDSAWSAFERGVRGTTFQAALAELGVEPSDEVIRQLVAVYRTHQPDITMLRDARACLDRLRNRALLAVISDGPRESQEAKAAAMDAHRWADPIVLTADLGHGAGKPSPRAFGMVEAATGTSGAACAYVADNPVKDFAGPRARGWVTVRVRHPESLHAACPSGRDVDLDVTDLAELPALLDRWLAEDGLRTRDR
jgi:putative hydrolase of the HAD superfamily